MHPASAAASTVLPLSCRSCCRIGSMKVSAYHSVPSSAWTPREHIMHRVAISFGDVVKNL
jgi:hypothetical protein